VKRAAARGWERAQREHQDAVADFIRSCQRVPPERWRLPMAEGKWSPAQVAEHLCLAYEALLRELDGGGGMRPRVGTGMQRLLRWVLLPHILFHRSFPLRARSPREIRPSDDALEQDLVEPRLNELRLRSEQALAESPVSHLSHPYFGPLSPVRTLRFCAVHIQHHRRQLDSVIPRG
jgi:hypothetical protein